MDKSSRLLVVPPTPRFYSPLRVSWNLSTSSKCKRKYRSCVVFVFVQLDTLHTVPPIASPLSTTYFIVVEDSCTYVIVVPVVLHFVDRSSIVLVGRASQTRHTALHRPSVHSSTCDHHVHRSCTYRYPLPQVIDSFGFETDLPPHTQAQAFCTSVFDHWELYVRPLSAYELLAQDLT